MIKKITFLTLILSSLLFGVESLTHYDQALKLFKDKNYKEAYKIFYLLSKNDLGNQNLNFYLGRCAYEEGEYDIAISYYERILFMQPTNLKTKIEIAQSNLMLKNYTQARKFFNEVLGNINTPFDIKEEIKAKLLYIEKTVQKHFFSGALVFDVSYDSNVNNSASSSEYSIFVPQLGTDLTLENSVKDESDYIYDAVAVLNHVYKYTNNISINSNFLLYSLDYDTKKDSNIDVISFTTTPKFYTALNTFSSGIGIDYIRFNDNDYLKNYNLILTHSHIFSPITLNELSFKTTKKDYDQKADKTKDSHLFELMNTLKHKTEHYGLFTLKTLLNKEISKKTTRTDVDKKSYEINLENSFPLPNKYNLTTSLGTKKVFYKDTDVLFLTKREDTINTVSLGISKPLRKNLLFALKGTIQKNISNQAPFDYKKHIIKSSLIYTF